MTMANSSRTPALDVGCVPCRPRLVASDLDGTLLRSDYTISPYTREVTRGLADTGIPFVIATGRALGAWLPTLEQVQPTVPVVCASGAMVVDASATTVLAEWPIPSETLAELVSRVHAFPGAVCAVERGAEQLRDPSYPDPAGTLARRKRVVHPDELVSEPASMLTIRLLGPDAQDSREEIISILDDACSPTDSGIADLIEVTAQGITKATGLAWVATELGIRPEDVWSFGDMPNDLPMLRWTGHAAAVRGAHPDVLATACCVTAGTDEDGVARRLLPLLTEGQQG